MIIVRRKAGLLDWSISLIIFRPVDLNLAPLGPVPAINAIFDELMDA